MQSSNVSTKKTVLASSLPIVIVGVYIFIFGLNIPVGDQWEFFSQYLQFQQGTMTFTEIFSQHNEHRPFFPRLIWIGLAHLTQYNVNAELWTNFLIVLSAFCFFVWQSRRFWIDWGVEPEWWTIPLVALVIFNLGQWESWLVGFQTIMYLGIFSVITGFFLLARYRSWLSFSTAIMFGFIATYSMVNGIFYWICGLFVIICCNSSKTRSYRLLIWLLFSSGSILLFFDGWHTNSHLAFDYILNNILSWGTWILNFLGAPIFTYWYIAWLFGIIGLLLYGKILLNSDKKQIALLSPYIAIALFVILTALAISSGRFAEDKPSYSVISRYLTISSWFWGVLFVLLPVLGNKLPYQRWMHIVIASSLVALMFGGAWVGYERRYLLTLPAYETARKQEMVTDADLTQLYPEPPKAHRLLEKLRAHKLSVYAEYP